MENPGFIKFLFIIANFIWFFILNNKFSRRYPFFRGYLWSLLFFPTYFILYTIFNSLLWVTASMANFNEMKTGVICFLIGLGIIIFLFINFNKLQDILFNWRIDAVQIGSQYFRNIILLGLAGEIVNTIYYFLMFKYVWMSLLGVFGDWIEIIGWFIEGFASMVGFDSGLMGSWMAVYQVIVAIIYLWIYNSGKNKLSILNQQILNSKASRGQSLQLSPSRPKNPYYSENYQNSSIMEIEVKEEIEVKTDNTVKLIELKQLLDDGIITQEEFTSMKQEILKEGI